MHRNRIFMYRSNTMATPQTSEKQTSVWLEKRTLRASTYGQYSVPKLKLEGAEMQAVAVSSISSNGKSAVFVGPNGLFYDIHYQPVFSTTDIPVEMSIPMPNPEKFDNFFDYEQALLDWKMKVENSLVGLRLPNVMGRHYSRPKVQENYDNENSHPSSNPSDTNEKDDENNKEGSTPTPIAHVLSSNNSSGNLHSDLNETNLDNNELPQRVPQPQVLDAEPWDCILVPPEPNPYDYLTLTEYEDALVRWAFLVSDLSLMPPHASQLKDLIPIQNTLDSNHVIIPSSTSNGKQSQVSSGFSKARTGIKEWKLFEDIPVSSVNIFDTILPHSPPPIKDPKAVKEKLDSIFAACDKSLNEINDKYGSINKPFLPILHGTAPRPWGSASMKSPINNKSRALRRTDLTGPMIQACMDCPGEIDGVKIEFKVPDFEVDSIDFSRLSDTTYQEQLIESTRQIQFSSRHSIFHSWYHPTVSNDEKQKHQDYVNFIIHTAGDEFNANTLLQIVSGDMFLDKFQDFLALPHREDLESRTNFDYFSSFLSPPNYRTLLFHFKYSKSPLLHAKLAYFIVESLQSVKGNMILENLVSSNDAFGLMFLAYAISFANDTPLDIFPFREDTLLNIQFTLGKKTADQLVLLTFCHYYLDIICSTINRQSFLYLGISDFVHSSKRSIAASLGSVSHPSDIRLIIKNIGHRASSFSSLFLFITLQLMQIPDPIVTTHMKSIEIDLYGQTKWLAQSKLMHAKYSARLLFTALSRENWIDFLCGYYLNAPERLIQDLTPPDPTRQSIIADMLLDLSLNILNNVTEANKKRASFLLEENVFHTLFNALQKYMRQAGTATTNLTAILGAVSKTYFRLENSLKASTELKPKKKGALALTLNPIDMQRLSSSVSDFTGNDLVKCYQTKRNALVCLRRLVKSPAIFEYVRKENDFYQRLLNFCKDGQSIEFNREAWRLFYQILRYHNGIMEHLDKLKILPAFLELVGTNSLNPVIMNGLHYVGKLLNMPIDEQKNPKRKDAKAIEKDLKILNTLFISKRLFIKIHMIYKKFRTTHPGAPYPGAPFFELANFYNILQNSPGASKLRKDTEKKEEYKEGLIAISSMYSPPSVAVEETLASANSPAGVQKKPIEKKGISPFSLARSGSTLPSFSSLSTRK